MDFGIRGGPGNNPKGQLDFEGVKSYTGPLNPALFKRQLYSNSIPGQDLCAPIESNYFTNHLNCWVPGGDYHLDKAYRLAGVEHLPLQESLLELSELSENKAINPRVNH